MSAQSLRVHGSLAGGSPRNGMPQGGGYIYRGTKFDDDGTPAQRAERQAAARRAVAAREARRKLKPIDHGTNAGWQAHYRRKENPCEPCRAAHVAACAAHKGKQP